MRMRVYSHKSAVLFQNVRFHFHCLQVIFSSYSGLTLPLSSPITPRSFLPVPVGLDDYPPIHTCGRFFPGSKCTGLAAFYFA